MVRDGAAVVRFLHWVEHALAAGETPTEYECQLRLRAFRQEGERFVSESFNTISAYNANAPIVHYAADEKNSARLAPTGLYLVDSGGQYLDGTTDITRTIALGSPSEEQKLDFTLVLKAHIALATTKFPVGTTGHELDAISRRPLWNRHANYGHGTGHGVGYFLNVHEGPQRISPRPSAVALEEGMIISNEPGLYHTGRYGIRIENLVAVTGEENGEFGSFREFETLTLCPIDRKLVDLSLLSADERTWLNAYHMRVREALASELPEDAGAWLVKATEPV
jgi:Xaa-Pro aminopeptidase